MNTENLKEFDICLQSDANLDTHPDNVISEFTVDVPPRELRGRWQVALMQCSYHRNMVNIENTEAGTVSVEGHKWTQQGSQEEKTYGPAKLKWRSSCHLPYPGNCSTPQTLIETLLDLSLPIYKVMTAEDASPTGAQNDYTVDEYRLFRDVVNIKFNPATQKATFFSLYDAIADIGSANSDFIKITLSDHLAQMLGSYYNTQDLTTQLSFYIGMRDKHGRVEIPSIHRMEFPVNVNVMYNMLIFTNIVQNSMLGSQNLAYLATVPLQGKEGEYRDYQFIHPSYKNVAVSSLRSIHTKAADLRTKNRVKFLDGSGPLALRYRFRQIPD